MGNAKFPVINVFHCKLCRIVHLPNTDFRCEVNDNHIVLRLWDCAEVGQNHTRMVDIVVGRTYRVIYIILIPVDGFGMYPFPLRFPRKSVVSLGLKERIAALVLVLASVSDCRGQNGIWRVMARTLIGERMGPRRLLIGDGCTGYEHMIVGTHLVVAYTVEVVAVVFILPTQTCIDRKVSQLQ